jgi:hypothetical protein
MSVVPVVEIQSFGIVIGCNEANQPACLILSCDALQEGGTLARAATEAVLSGSDLMLVGAQGTLALKAVADPIREAALAKLPLVVIDPNTEHEALLQVRHEGAADE